MILALEKIRVERFLNIDLGDEISSGLWVGKSLTPNRNQEAMSSSINNLVIHKTEDKNGLKKKIKIMFMILKQNLFIKLRIRFMPHHVEVILMSSLKK